MSMDNAQKDQVELNQKIQENADLLRELSKADSKDAEEFNKLQKSDQTLEDLRK